MSRDQQQDPTPVTDRAQLVEYFRQGEKSRAARGVGTEHEKFVFVRDDMSMLPFEGRPGVEALLEALSERYGWEPQRDRGALVALERDGAAITLEPGGQFELSGGVQRTIDATAREFDAHMRELHEVAGDELLFTCWGLNPFYEPDEIPWMPKGRYEIMRDYMPRQGDLATWMMKTTCTIQANYDYVSEEDAADILRSALYVSPLVSALFANSSVRREQPSGYASFRGHIWTRTDPARSGFPRFMYEGQWGYEEYLDYVLDIPMMFVRRGDSYLNFDGAVTFRQFVREGHQGCTAHMGDFELHLSTAFPEVRLKRYIEMRGADGGPRDHIVALPALWKGILYHEPSRADARELLEELDPDEHRELFHDVYRHALDAECRLGRVGDLAAELLALSRRGLDALAEEFDHDSEARFLDPLDAIAETGATAADRLLRDLAECGGDRRALARRWEL
jgi:glutamate--cysteine ligase